LHGTAGLPLFISFSTSYPKKGRGSSVINISYNQQQNTVFIEFVGKIDAAEGEQHFPNLPKVIPQHGKGFTLLVDLSLVESMDPKILKSITKAMDLMNASGVTKVIRVIPRLDQDIGLNIVSIFHYSKNVNVITVQSRKEAEDRL
jgi:anti-anti-sigma regulatory factor